MKKLRYALLLVAALPSGTFSITPRAQITQPFGWSVVTITSTGSQNNYSPPLNANTVVRCNNASSLTLTGLTAGYDGQHVKFEAINAQVDFAYSSASSSTGNKFINYLSTGNTSIVAGGGSGFAEYVYDATSQVWRLAGHDQGSAIQWTPAITGTAGSGITYTTQFGTYYVRGRLITVTFNILLSSIGTATGNASITGLPFTSSNISSSYSPVQNVYWSSAVTSYVTMTSIVTQNTTTATLWAATGAATGLTNVAITGFGASSNIAGNLIYVAQ